MSGLSTLSIRWKFSRMALSPSDAAGHARLSALNSRQRLVEYRELKRVMQNNSCFYCRCEMTPNRIGMRKQCKTLCTADHLIPRSNGGRTTLDNIVAACAKCNTAKGSIHWFDFIKKVHPLSIFLKSQQQTVMA